MRSLVRAATLFPVLLVLTSCASSPPQQTGKTPEIDPRNPLGPTLLMQQGQALVAENKVAEGLERYKAALGLQPKNPTIHNLIGVAELQRGNAAKALEAFNRALTLAPTYSDARNNRGAAYVQLGQFAMAETDFLSVLGDPTHSNRAGVYFNLGSLYFARGNLAAAEENLRKATLVAGPVDAYLVLGQVEERMGKPVLAETAYRAATNRAPERPDIALALAHLLEAQGRVEEARDFYRRIVELAPDSPEAKQARAKVGH